MIFEWHGRPFVAAAQHISDEYRQALGEAATSVFADDEPTDTTLASIMHSDQAHAEVDEIAGRVARYFELLAGSGMGKKAAQAMTAEYNSLLLAQQFMSVHEQLGAAMMTDWED